MSNESAISPVRSDRFASLDGLRGLAALIVVFHHLSLTLPAISNVYLLTGDSRPATASIWWWFSSTPAQLLIAGPEAVLVFFVLSGFVVVLPVIRKPEFDWSSYYPQRLTRLFLPAIAALAVTAVLILVSHESPATASSGWAAGSSFPSLSISRLISATDLLFGDTAYDNPLWTLRWEVLFSLMLPIFVIVAVATRRMWWVVLIGSWLVVLVGLLIGSPTLAYLPVFLVGSMLALKIGALRKWLDRNMRSRSSRALGPITLLLSLLLLNAHWIVWGALPGADTLVAVSHSFTFIGALGLVATAALWSPAVKLLGARLFQWLGRVSFSLYLVHVPIIIAVGSLLRGTNTFVTLAVSFVVAIAVAELFSRFVERPAHRLSRRIGAASSLSLRRHFEHKPVSSS